jgi:hypothetical protein
MSSDYYHIKITVCCKCVLKETLDSKTAYELINGIWDWVPIELRSSEQKSNPNAIMRDQP